MIITLLIIGIIMIISGFVLLVCTELTKLNPLISLIIMIMGMVIGAIGVKLSADSPQETSVQTQEAIGETAIIREYDINENLIKEWRVER